MSPMKVLVICGPTATGKTKFGLEMAKVLNGEIISADSRQVYTGKDIITGKDLPLNVKFQMSNVKWSNKHLSYYLIDGIKIWLYDVVNPGEPFNVAFWHECAELVIADIVSRKKLPIIVGGTGLFIKSLTHDLSDINVPYNKNLRQKFENKTSEYLFNHLKSLNSGKAASMNSSDQKNPRRLLRAIELSVSTASHHLPLTTYNYLQLCLSTSKESLYSNIDQRVLDRIAAGAVKEDPELATNPSKWQVYEHGLARRQITWFKKQSNLSWFDIISPNWQTRAKNLVQTWYNKAE